MAAQATMAFLTTLVLVCLCPACQSYRVPAHSSCITVQKFAPWDDGSWSVGEGGLDGPQDKLSEEEAPGTGGDQLVSLYQRYLRRPAVRGCCSCPFQPSCSVFSRNAFKRYGQIVGLALTLDRLFLRENAGRNSYYPTVCKNGKEVLFDPVP